MDLLPPTADDEPFLWEMLAHAAFPSGGRDPSEVRTDDHLVRYLEGWGADGDAGLVAWEGGRRVGASWLRLLPADRPAYGFVDAETPELAVAVVDDARGRGVGRALVVGALDVAAALGHGRVSLSVAGTNVVAAGLYQSLGFVAVGDDDGGSTTMVAPTAPAPPPPSDDPVHPPVARLATEEDGPAVARLRRVMLGDLGATIDDAWVDPLLALWPGEVAAGRWLGALVPGPDGRPVASALAVVTVSPPAPGRHDGRVAHVGSVATEAAWRLRGAARSAVTALLAELDRGGVQSSTLNASADGAGLYVSVGFAPAVGAAMRRPRP